MSQSQFRLLSKRRFLPLFIVQFFGAFNDNAFKLSMLTLISYHLTTMQSVSEHYQALAAALFTLPFFIFSATAGQLADKYDKAKLTIGVKLLEVILMVIGAWGLYVGHINVMMFVLFGMGVHSTFFGPIKYAILPNHLHEEELLAGNGLIEASTFTAILLGTLLGTLAIGSKAYQVSWAVLMIIGCALIGLIASFFIPAAKSDNAQLKIEMNLLKATWHIIQCAKQDSRLFSTIVAISWFWFVGTVILTKLPDYTHYELFASAHVFAVFLALFSIGIATGSLLINKLLSGKVSPSLAPFGLLGMTVFALDLYFATPQGRIVHSLFDIQSFFSHAISWRIACDFFLLAVSGGIFIVPLYAMLQVHSDNLIRSRIIAANNIINALFMVIAALIVGLLASIGLSIAQVFFILAILNILVAVGFCYWIGIGTIKNYFIKDEL